MKETKMENRKNITLAVVDPFMSKIITGFAWLNIVLGILLYISSARTLEFFIVNNIFTPQIWGIIFFIIGISLLFSYIFNIWKAMRGLMLLGFTIKLFWLLALLVRQIQSFDSNSFLIVLFFMLAYLQFWAYVHFPESVKRKTEKWIQA